MRLTIFNIDQRRCLVLMATLLPPEKRVLVFSLDLTFYILILNSRFLHCNTEDWYVVSYSNHIAGVLLILSKAKIELN